MAFEFKLPDIGEGVVEGEVVRWLVKEGDVLRPDQPMVEVMTDKATVEIPTPRGGRVVARRFAEGQICPVGQVLVVIDDAGAGPAQPATAPAAAPAPVGMSAPAAKPSAASPASTTGSGPAPRLEIQEETTRPSRPAAMAEREAEPNGRSRTSVTSTSVLATPATRKLARELGVDLESVTGSGPAGRITSEDVRAALERGPGMQVDSGFARVVPLGSGTPGRAAGRVAPAPAKALPESLSTALRTPPADSGAAADVRVPFRGVRRKIAERMVKARREAAHYTYVEEVDCTQLVALREKANQRLASQGIKLSYLPFIIKATVQALRKFPQMNAYLDEAAGEIVQRRQYHIGVASATADGLIVPVIRDADHRSIVDLARELERLAAATKAGKATRDELTGSTFTVTSLGQLGGVLATPILNHPEVAILGIHKIAKRPAVFEDEIVVRDLMNLSISVDHRCADGYDAARFVADIKESLESPGLLFLESI